MAELSIAEFLDYISKTKKKATSETYRKLLKGYLEFIGKTPEEATIFDIDRRSVEKYLRKRPPNTQNTLIAALRSYANFVEDNVPIGSVEKYLMYREAIQRVRRFKRVKTPRMPKKEALTVEELRRLFSLLDDNETLYNAAAVHFYLGARPIEIATPFVVRRIIPGRQDYGNFIDLENRLVTIVTAKTGDLRIIPYPREMEPFFLAWNEIAEEIMGYGGGRENEWFTKKMKKYSAELGIRITAKTARKTVETELSRMGVPQWQINYWLGHRTGIPDAYRDFTQLLDELRRNIAERHFILSVISVRASR